MLRKRIKFESNQSDRRTNNEIQLAERRVIADISLAERKFLHEKEIAQWKRKIELAEEVLVDFYECREIIKSCRNPGGFSEEGQTRPRADWETDGDVQTLNSYYVPIERLTKGNEKFSQLLSRRYRVAALFGASSNKPYDELMHIHAKIIVAARMLIIQYRNDKKDFSDENSNRLEKVIWETADDDQVNLQLNKVIKDIESVVRPVLQQEAP